MTRIKEAFTSHSQVCHVWAQQKQPAGHAGNMFFEDFTDIYSYGHHYLAAKMHDHKGERVALIRSDSYSNSTTKQLYEIERSVRGLVKYYRVPNVREIKSVENFNHFNDMVLDVYENILKTVKVKYERSIEGDIESLREIAIEANEFFKFAGFPLISIPLDMIEILREHLTFRFKRYQELNTPEMIAKRELESKKKNERELTLSLEKSTRDIKAWREGELTRLNVPHGTLRYDILRVKDNTVQSSGGAEVPLSHALRLLSLIERGQAREGERCGHFTLMSVTKFDRMMKDEPDTIVKIGCHEIRLSEAQSVLAQYRDQELRAV